MGLPRRRAAEVLMMLAVVGACSSCAAPRSTAEVDPFLKGSDGPVVASRSRVNGPHPPATMIRLDAGNDAQHPAARTTQPSATPTHQQVSWNTPAGSASGGREGRVRIGGVQTAAAERPADMPRDADVQHAIVSLPGSPRAILTPPLGPTAIAQLYPDEYLFDGGDRGVPVHFDNFDRHGFETEDAVAEYSDHTGERHVKPSNRVAIYAPRFAAVRTVSVPQADYSIDRLKANRDTVRTVGIDSRVVPRHHASDEAAVGVRLRARASGVETDADAETYDQHVRADGHRSVVTGFEDLVFLKTGALRKADEAHLADGIQAASVWTRDLNPVITANSVGGNEISTNFNAEVLVEVRDERTKGDLRIVKLADKRMAKPGETVTFSLRFDNLGDRELLHVRILDNLTPRLAYIEDSATSTLPGRIDVLDNNEGSSILRFVLDDPLPGHTGGVITFECRVR